MLTPVWWSHIIPTNRPHVLEKTSDFGYNYSGNQGALVSKFEGQKHPVFDSACSLRGRKCRNPCTTSLFYCLNTIRSRHMTRLTGRWSSSYRQGVQKGRNVVIK